MAVRTKIATLVPERSTSRYTAVIVDDAEVAIPAASLNTLTLTLYVLDADKTIINSVTAVNILNTGRGAVDSNGNLTITLTAADNQIVTATRNTETHVALIEWTYDGGTKYGRHEFEFRVQNMSKVPAA